MAESFHPVLILVRREVRDQFRDWRIVLPVVGLTIFFPGLLNFTANQLSGFLGRYGAGNITERLLPFLMLMVGFFPVTISLVIALESFVGEKERRSIEPLLSSPLEDWQLYLGKFLSALITPLLAGYLGTLVYLYGITRSVDWSPPVVLLVQVFILTAVQALLMVSGAVVISSQTTSVRAANLLASFVIIPVALLIEGESVLMFWARYDVIWLAILGQVVIAALLLRMGVAQFNREELIGRELDVLNIRWMGHVFRQGFTGHASSLREWFRIEIPKTLRSLLLPMAVMAGLLLLGCIFGALGAGSVQVPNSSFNADQLRERLQQGLQGLPLLSPGGIPLVWFQNIRALLLATLFGAFSFGVLGMLVVMLPLAIIGFVAAQAGAVGISPWLLLVALVAPHGIIEIPALIITGGAILKLGATLITPAHGKTIGEAWLLALADWAKVFLVLSLPLLLLSATLEVLVTPQVARWLLGG